MLPARKMSSLSMYSPIPITEEGGGLAVERDQRDFAKELSDFVQTSDGAVQILLLAFNLTSAVMVLSVAISSHLCHLEFLIPFAGLLSSLFSIWLSLDCPSEGRLLFSANFSILNLSCALRHLFSPTGGVAGHVFNVLMVTQAVTSALYAYDASLSYPKRDRRPVSVKIDY